MTSQSAIQDRTERVDVLLAGDGPMVGELRSRVARHAQRLRRRLTDAPGLLQMGDSDWLAHGHVSRREAQQRPAGLMQTTDGLHELEDDRDCPLGWKPRR